MGLLLVICEVRFGRKKCMIVNEEKKNYLFIICVFVIKDVKLFFIFC